MKKYVFYLLFVGSLSSFLHCSTGKYALTSPAEAELAIAQKQWPDVTPESLNHGYTIYTTRCNKCHGLKRLTRYTEAEWAKAINTMAPKAKLTGDEKEILKKYIFAAREVAIANSNKPK